MHLRRAHACFCFPSPPNLGISLQGEHCLQSSVTRPPGQVLHRTRRWRCRRPIVDFLVGRRESGTGGKVEEDRDGGSREKG
jgi:hypothetical protein